MTEIAKTPQTAEELIDALTDLKFGTYAPGISLSPSWKRGSGKYSTITLPAKQFQDELKGLSMEALQKRYKGAVELHIARLKREAEEQEAQAFYNQPHTNADFDHWSRAGCWTLEEGIALSLGKEPRWVNSKTLKDFGFRPLPRSYEQRLDLAKRAVFLGLLAERNLPGYFLSWARTTDIEIPDDLATLVGQRGYIVVNWSQLFKETNESHAQRLTAVNNQLAEALRVVAAREARIESQNQTIAELKEQLKTLNGGLSSARAVEQPLNPKSRTSLLKLVLGMAINGYGYDPRAEKSPIPQRIGGRLGRGRHHHRR